MSNKRPHVDKVSEKKKRIIFEFPKYSAMIVL